MFHLGLISNSLVIIALVTIRQAVSRRLSSGPSESAPLFELENEIYEKIAPVRVLTPTRNTIYQTRRSDGNVVKFENGVANSVCNDELA